MADDRPAETEVDALARLQRELEDLRSTVMVRVSRRPTGDIEPTIRKTAKGDTLLLQGQAVNRADYPVLWQWVQDNALIAAGLFTVGNGTTTFGLPNFAGRVPVGAGTLGTDVYALGAQGGASTQVLAVNQMPLHNHPTNSSGFTNTVPDHGHGTSGSTNSTGQHSGHFPGSQFNASDGGGGTLWGLAAWNSGGSFNGQHSHTVINPTFGAGGHNHTIDASNQNVGGSTPVDNRQPYVAVNWLVYT